MTKKKKRIGKPLSQKLKEKKFPFFVHANPLPTPESPYPTHSHGLNEIGWPEFMMDPLSFGPIGTTGYIHEAYKYFNKPQNRTKLERILAGEVIEVPIRKLTPRWKGGQAYTICFRRVSNDFEAVKQAFDPNGTGVDPDLVVVQIWVKGDDFALTDDYYRGGIKW